MIRVRNIKAKVEDGKDNLKILVAQKLNILPEEILQLEVIRQSIDARVNRDVSLVYTVDVLLKNEHKVKVKKNDIQLDPVQKYYQRPIQGQEKLKQRPVVIGMGPAGLFAALLLAEAGFAPLVLERGEDVDTRKIKVDEFWDKGILNLTSNVQFGEGGAGTFSDGKLTTSVKDLRCRKVLEVFVEFGAPKEILLWNKPHIGTDILRKVVKNIREKIQNLGGEIRFKAQVNDFIIDSEKQKIEGIVVNGETITASVVVLAIGHSARDTFLKLKQRGVYLSPKPFSVGVRIEHSQQWLNKVQYGRYFDHPNLGAADYKIVYHGKDGHSAYSFCMCPGGEVVGATSEKNAVVTNGMSYHARRGANANAAILVGVQPQDYMQENGSSMDGVFWQRAIEQKAFRLGGSNYCAPVQLAADFVKDCPSREVKEVEPSYKPGFVLTDLRKCLPNFVCKTLHLGLLDFEKRMPGFISGGAVLTGVETRSSSPLRIDRRSGLESINVAGLYPLGEGAGYAGGIMSAAVDGLKGAEKIIIKYDLP